MEKLMFEELLLTKEVEILQQRLSLVRAKLEFERKFNNPQEQKVICSPSSSQSEEQTNPEQTAPGKDIPNPLIAESLLKTLPVTSEINLRPNQGKAPVGASEQSLEGFKPTKKFYVVYNGPNPGIYMSWDVAKLAVEGVSGIQHQKFNSFEKAKISGEIYTSREFKEPLSLITNEAGLKPTYKKALHSTKKHMEILKLPKQKEAIPEFQEDQELTFSDFEYLYQFGRAAGKEKFVEESFFTTDKRNVSYFNFYPNASSAFVHEAFIYGLVELIYPSTNLLELQNFGANFRNSIKKFRKNCAKDKEIYLKNQSSILSWDSEDKILLPLHICEIGVVGDKKILQDSKPQEAKLEKEDFYDISVHKLTVIAEKLFAITEDSKIMINYVDKHLIMKSRSNKKISTEDMTKVFIFRQRFLDGKQVVQTHNESLCQKLKLIVTKASSVFSCTTCEEGTSETNKGKDKIL